MKVFAGIVIVLALLLSIVASFWPQDRLADIFYISRFFDIMLPVLAVGALIKYLCCCASKCGCTCCKTKNV